MWKLAAKPVQFCLELGKPVGLAARQTRGGQSP